MYIESMATKTSLKEQVIQKIGILSDAELNFFMEVLERLHPTAPKTALKSTCKIGICRGQKLLADDYDLDEDNVAIAEMFGVK